MDVFLESCKLIIPKHENYLIFINHYSDVLHGKFGIDCHIDQYPVYIFLDSDMNINYSHDKSEYDKVKIKRVSINTFCNMRYTISHHFRKRFMERFDKVSETRFRKLVGNMVERGTWLKRKDSIKLVKYKKTSSYIYYAQYEGNEKKHYLIVLTDQNILTTIYEFNEKDLKYFRET